MHFNKYKEDYDSYDEWNAVEDRNSAIGNCIPFMIFVLDNHFDEAEGYTHISALHEKAMHTSGKSDDAFFNALIRCRGEYPAAYSGLHHEQIACDMSTST